MIIDTTVPDKRMLKEIETRVGKPYSLLKMMKVGRIGSHRMTITSSSERFQHLLTLNNDLTYCNIELRPKGVIVHISKRNSRYSWVIPYHRLVIFSSTTFSIHGDGQFLKLKKDSHLQMNQPIIRKMLRFKQESTANQYYNVQM